MVDIFMFINMYHPMQYCTCLRNVKQLIKYYCYCYYYYYYYYYYCCLLYTSDAADE